MEEEDIAALLERELDLLDDAEEDFELGLNLLTEETAGNDIESEIQNELQELFVSANDLQHFATGGSESLRTTIHDNEQLEVDREIIPEAPIIPSDSSNYAYIDPQLTEEEFLILKELMELMVESVERCAPICARTEITPMVIRSADIPTLTAIPLQLITEDSDVQISSRDIPQDLPVPESSNISGLWSDKLSAEAQLVKEQRIQSAQESDRVMWDEANRFKQEMEQERLRREERRQTREAAKRAAIMDKSARNIQRLVRGYAARKIVRVLLQRAREARLAQEAQLALARQRALEEAEREAQRQQREQEAAERRTMAEKEAESRRAWAAVRAQEERRRLAEAALFAMEDQLAASICAAVLQARERVQEYQRLAAQEDVEYDFGAGYGSDSDEDAASVGSEHGGGEGGTAAEKVEVLQLNSFGGGAHAITLSETQKAAVDPGTGLSVQLQRPGAIDAAAVGSSAGSIVTAVVSKPAGPPSSLKPAPRGPKVVVSVDPTQGKRWGGSISTAAWSSAEEASSVNTAADASSPEVVVSAEGSTAEVKVSRPHAYSMTELAALEADRLQQSQWTFAEVESPSTSAQTSTRVHSVLVEALRYWQLWRDSYRPATVIATVNTLKGSTNSATAVSARAERDNEAALQNSMVDLDTDPLLARELDFSVEGLSSTAFLSKFAYLTKLALNVNKLTEVGGLSSLSMLVSLSVKDNKISDVTALSNLSKLRYLHLDSNRIADLSGLSGLPDLTTLCANSNQIADIPCLNCARLQRLELSRNRITCVPDGCLQGMPGLVHLTLSSNQIVSIAGEALSACPLLQTLALSENQLQVVPSPLRLPMLKSLRLNLNRLTNLEEWCHRPSCPWPLCAPSLQKLILSDNQITTLPSDEVFQGLVLLEELDVSFNAIAERDCLAGLGACRLLTALHIQDNLFTTVLVTGAVAGTSRTALGAPQMQQLLQWLLSVCPGLETVSGNRLDKAAYAEGLAQLRGRQVLEHYTKTGAWLLPTEGVTSAAYLHDSATDREIISLLQAHQQAQNVLTVTERAVKKDEVAATKSLSKRVNVNPADAANDSASKRDWDVELASLLHAQLQQLGGLVGGEVDRIHAPSSCVIIGYKKAANLDQSTSGIAASKEIPVLSLSVAALASERTATTSRQVELQGTDSTSTAAQAGQKGTPPAVPTAQQIITLQRHYRGHRVRKRLGGALKSIRYRDDELDDLYGAADLDLDLQGVMDMDLDLSYLDEEVPVAMVYGDHIRRRSRPGSSIARPPPSAAAHQESSGTMHGPSFNAGVALRDSVDRTHNNWVLPADDAHSPSKVATAAHNHLHRAPTIQSSNSFPEPSRPSTGMSSLSAHSDAPDSAAMAYGSGAASPAGSRSDLSARSDGTGHGQGQGQRQGREDISMMSSARRSQRAAAAQQMAQEWGISDPKVLAVMMKRTQRMQSFADEKLRKELDKDPLHRLEKFQRSAAGAGASGVTAATTGNTRTSGSFGGAPKTTRGAGTRKKRSMAPPAWLLGANFEGGGDDEGENH